MTARPQDVALLPCPFCGATPTMDNIRADESQGWKWGAVICGCGVVGPEVRTGYSAVEVWSGHAITEWNTRANVTAALASAQAREEELRAEVERLTGVVRGMANQIADTRHRAERLEEALRKVATVAHAGGSVGMSEADALTAIRKLTLKHWDRNAEPKHVRAALSTNAATQTGETNEAAE